jgi:putative protease
MTIQENTAARARTPELLAPAGDAEALRAAVANGADAVYFGLSDFNARYRATNFTLEELPATMRYLHERGVRGYVTFNTLIFSDELPRAVEFISAIAEAGADAVIVQDLGLARLIRRVAPSLAIHGSTQMTLTEPRGIELVRRLGVERVILARELSIREIERIRSRTEMLVEVFVHGALCVAYSGQCLTSESFGGRSANRGQCAQACRQPYDLIVDGDARDLGDKAYLLSPQDLAAYDLVGDLARAGVTSLKIEGRLKSAHYVAVTTQTYRAALDAAARGEPFSISHQQELDLAQSFSRGFTHGFLSGVNHQELVQGRFPKSRGVRIGTVIEITQRGVLVKLDAIPSPLSPLGRGAGGEGQMELLPSPNPGRGVGGEGAARSTKRRSRTARSQPRHTDIDLPIKPGDGVVFDEGHPEQDEQGGRVFSVTPISESTRQERQSAHHRPSPTTPLPKGARGAVKPGGTAPSHASRLSSLDSRLGPGSRLGHDSRLIDLTFGRGDVNLAAIAPGSIVWKTDDPALRRRLEKTYVTDRPARREMISVRIEGRVGEPLRVRLIDASGHSADVTGDALLPVAIKHPLTVDLIREQFGRLGDTPFELGAVELHGDTGRADQLPVMVPKSVLNDLRRRAVAALIASRGRSDRPPEIRTNALDKLRAEIARGTGVSPVEGSPETLAPHLPPESLSPCGGEGSSVTAPSLAVLVRSVEQLEAALAWSQIVRHSTSLNSHLSTLNLVHCDFEDVRQFRDAVTKCRDAGVAIALATPRIVKPSEEGLLRQVANCLPDAVLVRNLAALTYFQEVRRMQPALRLIGDYSLNVANEITAALFAEQGVTRMVPSYDLNMTQLEKMLGRIDPGLFEVVLHQHIPMFHMEHCVFSHVLSNGRDAHECGRPCDRHGVELRDHTGEAHPLVADVGCRNTVFRAEAQSAAAYAPRLIQIGVRHFRVEMLCESATEAAALLDTYRDVLAGKVSAPTRGRSLRVLTQIGVSAGTFDFD